MSEVEAIGDVMTGGIVAHAVEPETGPHRKDARTSGRCLNCGARLTGAYCANCGQAAHVHRTLGSFGHDLLHGVFHFEGKIWRTLPMLAWHPGALTRRYVAGERARFVSPLALFLFSAFLTFAVFGWTGGPFGKPGDDVRVDGASLDEGIADATREIAALERRRAETVATGGATISLDTKLKQARDGVSTLRMIKERGITEATLVRASDDIGDAPEWINRAYKKAKANPSLLIYKLQNNAYKYSWMLIPISVPFMWLLFPFSRRFHLYDHAVFVTYSLCFMTLLLVALSVVKMASGSQSVTEPAMSLVPAIHMYRQLRGAYGLRWWSALLRTALLLIFCVITATLFGLILVAMGVLG